MNNEDLHYIDLVKLQYERIAQHETQRLNFSGLVLTLTTAVFAVMITVSSDKSVSMFIIMSVFLIVINLAAVLFVYEARGWVKFHQSRARSILKKYNPDLLVAIYNDSNNQLPQNTDAPKKKDSGKNLFNRVNLQMVLHISLIVITFAIICFKLKVS